jgi:hypothetical protein
MSSPYYQTTVEAERTPGAVAVSGHTVTAGLPDERTNPSGSQAGFLLGARP